MLNMQVHEYSVCAFVPVSGPMLVRITNDEDLEQFYTDADLARDTGEFNEVLVHPLAELADKCALSGSHDCLSLDLRRVYVGADGSVGAAAGGLSIGHVSEGFAAFEQRMKEHDLDCAERCLGETVHVDDLRASRSARPWIAQYLLAVDAVRGLAAQGQTDVRVSGFGAQLANVTAAAAPVDPALVFVFNRERSYLYRSNGRTFAMSLEAATALEAYNLTGSVDEAVRCLATAIGVSAEEASRQVTPLVADAIAVGMIVQEADDAGNE